MTGVYGHEPSCSCGQCTFMREGWLHPGPWEWRDNLGHYGLVDAQGNFVVATDDESGDPSVREQEGDLIAAAPTMFDLLRRAARGHNIEGEAAELVRRLAPERQ